MTEIMVGFWIGMVWGFLVGVGVSFTALAIRIWWINRGLPFYAKWPMFGG